MCDFTTDRSLYYEDGAVDLKSDERLASYIAGQKPPRNDVVQIVAPPADREKHALLCRIGVVAELCWISRLAVEIGRQTVERQDFLIAGAPDNGAQNADVA